MISGKTASFGFILSVICTGLNLILLVILFDENRFLTSVVAAISLASSFLLYVLFGMEVTDYVPK